MFCLVIHGLIKLARSYNFPTVTSNASEAFVNFKFSPDYNLSIVSL